MSKKTYAFSLCYFSLLFLYAPDLFLDVPDLFLDVPVDPVHFFFRDIPKVSYFIGV